MKRYIIIGKYTSDYLAGMIHNPQDRRKVSKNFMEKGGVKLADGDSFLFVNHPEYDLFMVVFSDNDDNLKASIDMIKATGNYEKLSYHRAWESSEYVKVSKKAAEFIEDFVDPSQYISDSDK